MCGICGFAGIHDEQLLRRMTDTIVHRGPDGAGYYNSSQGIGLGMRRLAIIDLATGDQPIYNEDKSIAVVFNGEIYNFMSLRADLAAKGHRFYTKTDTEVIVHLYEEYGDDCPKHMRGMFAFALWDTKKQKLLLARDHVGVKPLYYAEVGGKLLFGSEIKCLLQYPGISTELDYTALDYFFTFLYIPQPYSIYKQIRKLPPASVLVLEKGKTTIRPYWSVPAFAPSAAQSEEYYVENIAALLRSSVEEQKVSDVPLGVFLSGGIDSSTVVALMSEILDRPVKTFAIGYGPDDPSYDETKKARLVAKKFNCDHREYTLKPDVVSILPKLVDHFDEPFADSSSIPNFLISGEVRKEITVALTGIGGDEIFTGYPRHLGARLSSMYERLPYPARALASRLARRLPESTKSRNVAGWLKRFARGGTMDFQRRYISWMSYFTEEEKKNTYTEKFRSRLGGATAPRPDFLAGVRSPDDLFAEEIKTYLADDLLCLSDRTSMANSLELRVPFLDVRLIEFMSQIPIAQKTPGFNLKYLLKRAMRDKLPPEIIGQKKMGFQIPIARWINEEIEPMIAELLDPAKIKQRGFLKPEYVATILRQHKEGMRNFSDQIYAMLVFELWLGKTRNPASESTKLSVNSDPTKILIINLGGIGDIIMMEPVLKALKAAYPSSSLSLLTIPRSDEVSRPLPGLERIHTIPMRYRVPSPLALFKMYRTLKRLRNERFDITINLREVQTKAGKFKMWLLMKLIKPALSIGRNIEGRGSFYHYAISEKEHEALNEVELTAKLLAPLGIGRIDTTIRYPVFAQDREFMAAEFKKMGVNGETLIGINPGAFRPSRRWPLPYWQNLIRKLSETHPGCKIFITGGKDELDIARTLQVSDNVIVTNGKYSLRQLAALFERFHVFITNDTGPMHLAAAVGTRIVAIFGPGDVQRFAPSVPKENYRIVRKEDIQCRRPCYRYECENPVCLTEIKPSDVAGAVSDLLTDRP